MEKSRMCRSEPSWKQLKTLTYHLQLSWRQEQHLLLKSATQLEHCSICAFCLWRARARPQEKDCFGLKMLAGLHANSACGHSFACTEGPGRLPGPIQRPARPKETISLEHPQIAVEAGTVAPLDAQSTVLRPKTPHPSPPVSSQT